MPYRTWMKALFWLCLALFAGGAPAAEDGENWQRLRELMFGDRPIDESTPGVIDLDAPVRAEDGAVVPIAVMGRQPQSPGSYVRKIWLIVDQNPSPVGVIFTLTPESGRVDVETRIRIETYTMVRAVAELNDGRLYMAKRFVKASGGCSAPAGKDLAEAMTRLGRMRLRLENAPALNEPNLAQLMISHPNVSGMAKDQLTHLYAPPHFVRRIEVSYAGRPVLVGDVDFTLSENPNLRFYFLPTAGGELKARVVDSNDLVFESAIQVAGDTQSR